MKQNFLIADDHPLMHKGLVYLFKHHLQEASIQSAYDGQELFDALLAREYDLLILDVNMPLMSFSDFEQIVLSYPNLKILIFTQYEDEHIAVRYLKKGAYGFMGKNTSDDNLISVIKTILKGNKTLSPTVMNHMVHNRIGTSMQNPLERLSAREYDIVLEIAKGFTLTEIAEKTNLSLSAISTYKNRAMTKMYVKSLVGLIEMCKEYVK